MALNHWNRCIPSGAMAAALTRRSGFEPVSAPDARVLVLGSLPGEVSLTRGQYYAQPRNAFWKITGALFGFPCESSYADRLASLNARRVAIWDVCASAARAGSLDSAISDAAANGFQAFLRTHSQLRLIAFNGAKAAELYRRLVIPTLPAPFLKIPTQVLPSTSPAHAAMPYGEKLKRWQIVADVAQGRVGIAPEAGAVLPHFRP
jgi:TDG/mug DNA glycosylase family protein